MRQCISPKPFSSILTQSIPLTGRWSGLAEGTDVIVPAKRRTAEAKLHTALVRTIAGLLEGTSAARFVAGADPAIVVDIANGDQIDSFLYRTRANQVYATSAMPQSPEAAALFAVRLLTYPKTDFAYAYVSLLAALESDSWAQPELDGLMASAADELAYACVTDLALDETPSDTVWFYAIGPSSREMVEELDNPGTDLAPLLRDPAALSNYLYLDQLPAGLEGLKLPKLPTWPKLPTKMAGQG
jgi:hypothetical protein